MTNPTTPPGTVTAEDSEKARARIARPTTFAVEKWEHVTRMEGDTRTRVLANALNDAAEELAEQIAATREAEERAALWEETARQYALNVDHHREQREKAEAEIGHLDSLLSGRPALDSLRTRFEKIEYALATASRADAAEAHAARWEETARDYARDAVYQRGRREAAEALATDRLQAFVSTERQSNERLARAKAAEARVRDLLAGRQVDDREYAARTAERDALRAELAELQSWRAAVTRKTTEAFGKYQGVLSYVDVAWAIGKLAAELTERTRERDEARECMHEWKDEAITPSPEAAALREHVRVLREAGQALLGAMDDVYGGTLINLFGASYRALEQALVATEPKP